MHWDYAHSFHPLRFFIKPDSVLRPCSTICKIDGFSCWKLDETDKWLSRKYSFLLEVTQGKNMPINCGWVGLSSHRWKCTYTYQYLTEKDTIIVWSPSVKIFQHTGAGRTIAAYVFFFFNLKPVIKIFPQGFPCWLSGKESACQCRRCKFDPWSRKIPHAAEQLSPWKPQLLNLCSRAWELQVLSWRAATAEARMP